MRHLKRLGLLTPEARQAPFAEFHTPTGLWRIWQSFSSDVSSGTYVILYPTGMAERVTTHEGQIMDTVILTGPVISEPT